MCTALRSQGFFLSSLWLLYEGAMGQPKYIDDISLCDSLICIFYGKLSHSDRYQGLFEYAVHRLNMKLDHKSLFWLRPRDSPPPPPSIWAHIRGRYWSAKLDDISYPWYRTTLYNSAVNKAAHLNPSHKIRTIWKFDSEVDCVGHSGTSYIRNPLSSGSGQLLLAFIKLLWHSAMYEYLRIFEVQKKKTEIFKAEK